MNFAEMGAQRELLSKIESMELRIKELERRADDQSKAHRLMVDDQEKSRTLTLKKAHG